MARVAIVTDSASDLSAADVARTGIVVVPLLVRFGTQEFRAGVDLTADAFWERMLEPDAPFPTTAAAAPGDFRVAFERLFAEGADGIVCVTVGGKLSGTLKSAQVAREMLAHRPIEIVDSNTASMGVGILALEGAERAAAGQTAAAIAADLRRRVPDVELYVALDTLEYLKKGGRISGARAAVGTLLAVKPIITVRDGIVEQADRVRTRAKARERLIELLTSSPVDRLAVLAGPGADAVALRDELIARLGDGVDPARVTIETVGPSIGPHIGPGFAGGIVLRRR